MDAVRWYDEPAEELSAGRLHELLALRNAVFVVEQACVYQDIDGRDLLAGTRHVWADGPDGMVAYARLLAPGAGGPARIGRVLVVPAGRGTGLGHDLVEHAVAGCRRAWPGTGIMLAAQAHLQDFYGRHGFVPRGEVYDEDGIDHVDMVWEGAAGPTS
ncbi:MAG: GNAT family N-acetyltransferase [Marmoricola sp.]